MMNLYNQIMIKRKVLKVKGLKQAKIPSFSQTNPHQTEMAENLKGTLRTFPTRERETVTVKTANGMMIMTVDGWMTTRKIDGLMTARKVDVWMTTRKVEG
jgi:hypothetical protein